MKSKDKLKEYLREKKLTQKQFASLCKIHPGSVNIYLQGCNIHPKIAHKIEKYTRGELLFEDLTDAPRGKKYTSKYALNWDK